MCAFEKKFSSKMPIFVGSAKIIGFDSAENSKIREIGIDTKRPVWYNRFEGSLEKEAAWERAVETWLDQSAFRVCPPAAGRKKDWLLAPME